MATFATSADAVDSGVLRAKTRPVISLPIVAPAPAPPSPAAAAVTVPSRAAGGSRRWWWLALLAAGGYLVWRQRRGR